MYPQAVPQSVSHLTCTQAELASLKAEVHTLNDQLREAENRARRAAGTTPFHRLPDATASERLAHAERAAAEAQQALAAANSSAAEAARSALCALQGKVHLLPCRASSASHTSSSRLEERAKQPSAPFQDTSGCIKHLVGCWTVAHFQIAGTILCPLFA